MSHPFRENLEVVTAGVQKRIRCSRCFHVFCQFGEDWQKHCKKRTFPPVKAGPLMSDLEGSYLLEKFYCPSCGALLESELVEQSAARG